MTNKETVCLLMEKHTITYLKTLPKITEPDTRKYKEHVKHHDYAIRKIQSMENYGTN